MRKVNTVLKDPHFLRLAEKCKQGDAEAMRAMADFFFLRCNAAQRALLSQYEAGIEGADTELRRAMHAAGSEGFALEKYMLWIVRAALYQQADTAAPLQSCPLYGRHAFLPYALYTDDRNASMTVISSDLLREMGFIDIPAGLISCVLHYYRRDRFFSLAYLSDYEPPDEDGFGEETEYTRLYFDEFFCRLPLRENATTDQIRRALAARRR